MSAPPPFSPRPSSSFLGAGISPETPNLGQYHGRRPLLFSDQAVADLSGRDFLLSIAILSVNLIATPPAMRWIPA